MEDLPLRGGVTPTLSEADRFLAVARLAPNAVAVHGGVGGLGTVGTLIAAHLISGHGFPSEAAIAWVRMIHPAALLTAHRAFLRAHEAAMCRRRFSHSFSTRAGALGGAAMTTTAQAAAAAAGAEEAILRSASAPRMHNLDVTAERVTAAIAPLQGEAADQIAAIGKPSRCPEIGESLAAVPTVAGGGRCGRWPDPA